MSSVSGAAASGREPLAHADALSRAYEALAAATHDEARHPALSRVAGGPLLLRAGGGPKQQRRSRGCCGDIAALND
jgi:hypothetical protein